MFLTNDAVKNRFNSKVIDEHCGVLVHGCILKGHFTRNHDHVPLDDPEIIEIMNVVFITAGRRKSRLF